MGQILLYNVLLYKYIFLEIEACKISLININEICFLVPLLTLLPHFLIQK